jgi:hypothetical protein
MEKKHWWVLFWAFLVAVAGGFGTVVTGWISEGVLKPTVLSMFGRRGVLPLPAPASLPRAIACSFGGYTYILHADQLESQQVIYRHSTDAAVKFSTEGVILTESVDSNGPHHFTDCAEGTNIRTLRENGRVIE